MVGNKDRDLKRQYLVSLADSARIRSGYIAAKIAKARQGGNSESAKAWLAALKAQIKKNSQVVNSVDNFINKSFDSATDEELDAFIEHANRGYKDSSVE